MEENANFLKHLMISLGEHTYLILHRQDDVCEGQCSIVPINRVPASNEMDEEVWAEVERFKVRHIHTV